MADPTDELLALYAEAEKLAERPVEVQKVAGEKYAVVWLRYEVSPPEPADTEEGALRSFIAKMLQLKKAEDNI